MSYENPGKWVKFFTTAGIPAQTAATYAHIFVENRIQQDMLIDLNKEYLREMGISPMGDIIAILRHSKIVQEQYAREKVLSSEVRVPVAAVQANPVNTEKRSLSVSLKKPSSSSKESSIRSSSSRHSEYDSNRTLSSIIANHNNKESSSSKNRNRDKEKTPPLHQHQPHHSSSSLYSDKEIFGNKPKVFERLQRPDLVKDIEIKERYNKERQVREVRTPINSEDEDDFDDDDDDNNFDDDDSDQYEDIPPILPTKKVTPKVKMIGIDGKIARASTTSSIFARLGKKDSNTKHEVKTITSILKSSTTKTSTSGVSESSKNIVRTKPRVILVKKIPAKATMLFPDEPAKMETGEKTVSFSEEDEVLEIASRPMSLKNRRKGVRSRLGAANAALFKTRKPNFLINNRMRSTNSYNVNNKMKASNKVALGMASDDLMLRQGKIIRVKDRLGVKDGDDLANRIGRVSLSSVQKMPERSSSVFDRLGFSKK